MVIGRDYFTRQATILLKFAKATKDQKVAASLIEKAADLNLQVDEPGAPAGPEPFSAGCSTRKVMEGRLNWRPPSFEKRRPHHRNMKRPQRWEH
jgi:hypothetical protein